MVSCKHVANTPHSKYGILRYTTQRSSGLACHRATNAHIRVPTTSKISIEASRLFLSPNWIGVNAALNTRLSTNGSATIQGICLVTALYNTVPKERAIITYNTLHTGPNNHEGGAQKGLINCEYQVYVFIYFTT